MLIRWFGAAIIGGWILAALVRVGLADEPECTAEWGLFPNGLIGRKVVQKELNLRGEQVEKLTVLMREFGITVLEQSPDAKAASPDQPALSEEERIKRIGEANAKRAERLKRLIPKFSSRFAKILDQPQIERLRQILWQTEGARAYRDQESPRQSASQKASKQNWRRFGPCTRNGSTGCFTAMLRRRGRRTCKGPLRRSDSFSRNGIR